MQIGPAPERRTGAVASLIGSLLLATLACGTTDRFDDYIGRMDDDSYAGQRWRALGPNGLGEDVELADFEGRFVWVDYSATWCGYCSTQAGILRGLENALGDEVVFLTVIVDGGEPMTDPTVEIARDWAERFGLDARAVVAQRIYVGPVPHHFLFSPEGQTLYRGSGLHSADRIRAKLAEHAGHRNDLRAGGSDSGV